MAEWRWYRDCRMSRLRSASLIEMHSLITYLRTGILSRTRGATASFPS